MQAKLCHYTVKTIIPDFTLFVVRQSQDGRLFGHLNKHIFQSTVLLENYGMDLYWSRMSGLVIFNVI